MILQKEIDVYSFERIFDICCITVGVLVFTYLVANIYGCSTINIDCIKEENRQKCLERRYNTDAPHLDHQSH